MYFVGLRVENNKTYTDYYPYCQVNDSETMPPPPQTMIGFWTGAFSNSVFGAGRGDCRGKSEILV